MKYAFVENNRRQYGVPALCEALQVVGKIKRGRWRLSMKSYKRFSGEDSLILRCTLCQ